MAKKKKSAEKSPWGKHSVEDIKRTEHDAYVIQMGMEIFDSDGKIVFNSRAVAVYYNKILNNLLDIIDGGDEDERNDAIRCLGTLHVHPLRIN